MMARGPPEEFYVELTETLGRTKDQHELLGSVCCRVPLQNHLSVHAGWLVVLIPLYAQCVMVGQWSQRPVFAVIFARLGVPSRRWGWGRAFAHFSEQVSEQVEGVC